MCKILIGWVLISLQTVAASAGSELLKGVKRNPQQAQAMCSEFQNQNKNNESVYSRISIRSIAASRNIDEEDAEVLVTYVVGMHCPDVR
ncbi:hypothetical protein [Synechococcus sp. M16CYN]|uniref:hypothetical protein n=1 Tax=Synechococcus sp. M16CYN TaxID=3103139 RepID=UPI00324BACD9